MEMISTYRIYHVHLFKRIPFLCFIVGTCGYNFGNLELQVSPLLSASFLLELWSVTMVFVSNLSNAIITLNSYC